MIGTGKVTIIYRLVDSRLTDPIARVRYVGKTSSNTHRRMVGHRYSARMGEQTARACWMRSVWADGGEVFIEPIECVPEDRSAIAEQYWIARYRSLGSPLMNLTDGGEGLSGASPETRAKIGASKKGHKFWVGKRHTPESRAKMSRYRTGRPNPYAAEVTSRPEVRAKIAATLAARDLTPDELTNKRAHVARHFHSPEGRAKRLAVTATPEYRARASAAHRTPKEVERARALGYRNRGRKFSPEIRAKMAIAQTGRHHSDETKARMSAWQQGEAAPRAKLAWAQVREIRAIHAAGGVSQHALARWFGVTPRSVNLIVHRRTWHEPASQSA